MKTVTNNLGMIVFLLLFVPFMDSCTRDKGTESSNSKSSIAGLLKSMSIQPVTKPAKAPDFDLHSVDGERVRLKQYRGKVVLLSFWTTW